MQKLNNLKESNKLPSPYTNQMDPLQTNLLKLPILMTKKAFLPLKVCINTVSKTQSGILRSIKFI